MKFFSLKRSQVSRNLNRLCLPTATIPTHRPPLSELCAFSTIYIFRGERKGRFLITGFGVGDFTGVFSRFKNNLCTMKKGRGRGDSEDF